MITPQEFLKLIKDGPSANYKIGTVGTVNGNKAKIKFDGEQVESGKEYLGVGYSPSTGDRVLLINVSGTYLILGAIGGGGGGSGGDISFGGTDIPLLKLEDLKILSIPRNATSTMREVIVKFDGTMAITFTLFVAGSGSPTPLHAEFLVNNILQGDKITVASFNPVETIVEIAVRENDNIKFNVSHDSTSTISARSNLFQLNVYPIFNINPVTHII